MGNLNPNNPNNFGTSVVSQMTQIYTTFSGVDITALFDDLVIMTLQGIAVSITREKVPVYTIGSARPRSISRGKRGIAGTLQFVLFDRDALNVLVKDPDHRYYAHQNEVNWLINSFNAANYHRDVEAAVASGQLAQNPFQEPGVAQTVARSVATEAQYMDQIFPFDITLMAQNEYGQGSWSSVIGVEIINEGGGISMDDITSEEQATYIAIHRHPWTPLDDVDRTAGNIDYWASNAILTAQGTIDSVRGT